MSELPITCQVRTVVMTFGKIPQHTVVFEHMRVNRSFPLLASLLFAPFAGVAQKNTTCSDINNVGPFSGPIVYREPQSGTLLYVETDGRHVSSISADGNLLWTTDPFEKAHLEFYRTRTPKIVCIGPTVTWKSRFPAPGNPREYVWIRFNSSQFGVLRVRDGYFQVFGQD